ncbi:MAG: phytanoyl-CoA dioxygenase family protein [Candidatus Handelsmanbacteria bacterium]|nr:phytanoyl-CoA dioxygenase family protein [Candidatus Handelsmanbacteria bacterium]
MSDWYSDADLDLKVAELKINGYAVFEGLIPAGTIDSIRAAFTPLLEQLRVRETQIHPTERGEVKTGLGRQQFANRYTLHVPWQPPFAEPAIYEHPGLLAFFERYWGSDDFQITCYHSNNPYPGSQYQPWHRDIGLLAPGVGLQTCPHFGIKFPLVDTCEENGSFEVLPGSQYLADSGLEGRYDEFLRQGHFPSTHRLNLKKGTLWIQDPRTLHRGTPNRSDHARPELVLCFSRSWFAVRHPLELSRAEFGKLSERGRKLLARSRVV